MSEGFQDDEITKEAIKTTIASAEKTLENIQRSIGEAEFSDKTKLNDDFFQMANVVLGLHERLRQMNMAEGIKDNFNDMATKLVQMKKDNQVTFDDISIVIDMMDDLKNKIDSNISNLPVDEFENS